MEIQQKLTAICLRRIAANFRKNAADTNLLNYRDLMFKAADDLELCAFQFERAVLGNAILPPVKSGEVHC
jgi:hypothetical protein